MGYCIEMTEGNFHIPAAKFGDALAAVKALILNTDAMHGGSYEGGERVERWYSWVNNAAVLESETLVDALDAWRWEAYCGDSEDISLIYFRGEKLGQDDILFRALAPYVTAGSYVAMRGEDGALWRWYFDGTNCIEQEGRVVYE